MKQGENSDSELKIHCKIAFTIDLRKINDRVYLEMQGNAKFSGF